jgi:hypothetical protein
MSFTLSTMACRWHRRADKKNLSRIEPRPGECVYVNPRTAGCSGYTPALPYPLNRALISTHCLNNVSNNQIRSLNEINQMGDFEISKGTISTRSGLF